MSLVALLSESLVFLRYGVKVGLDLVEVALTGGDDGSEVVNASRPCSELPWKPCQADL